MPEEPDFNGFGSYRRKRPARDAGEAAPRRSFRRIPRDQFPADGPESAGGPPDAGEAAPDRPFRKKPFAKKPFGRKPFGKKPFGKKPFAKKPFGHGKPHDDRDGASFRDLADTIDEADVPPPRRDRSFKNSGRHSGDGEDAFPHPRKPFGKKPFGKFRPPFKKRPYGGDDGDSPHPPRALRRPYGVPSDDFVLDEDAPDAGTPPRKPFRKPFGKKPFGKKPFGKKPFGKKPFGKGKPFGRKPFHGGEPFPGESSEEATEGRHPFGKKPFGKKPFGKKPFPGKKPFGKKPFGKGKPFNKKPFGSKFRKRPPHD